jgi:hypothetical protein
MDMPRKTSHPVDRQEIMKRANNTILYAKSHPKSQVAYSGNMVRPVEVPINDPSVKRILKIM